MTDSPAWDVSVADRAANQHYAGSNAYGPKAQTAESDMAPLTRFSSQYDAVAKPVAGMTQGDLSVQECAPARRLGSRGPLDGI